ncbi:TerB N-terminal domain-containing protein [Paenibacillus sp. ISL-20]|uniref:TerB N-terminal domain-containing protein n=1 Tax=Paenibacillus sp. ISL-20 TaxID=2819163 RepID=UPI001BE7FAEB|nr:TerB N-terminal domain-containing protein [Paenibacillus sp. ISL-20]MBT2764366.1 TerB N-terminal domain-containing protein [Paenibacillus sp. ISL-20]
MKNDKPNNDNHIEHIRHTTLVNDQGIRFAEFELAGDEQDVSLLDKPSDHQGQEPVDSAAQTKESLIVKPQQPLDMNWGEDFRYVTKEQQFVQKARELAWHVEGECPFVAFKSYWPTYDQMASDQFKWYFYWREEVRSGRYPDTDLSYLFVYFYELIHGVGWSDPLQGYALMEQAWTAYRKRYAKLDTYLREWLYDFMIVHSLDMPIRETYQRFPRVLSAELKEKEWKRRFSLQPVELTWELLLDLLDYDVEKSRFYQENGRKDLERYAPKVIALVDSYWAKMKGQRFIDRFQPRPRQVKRYLFRSAVYDHGLYGRNVVLTVVSLSEYAPLRSYITGLVRLTENKLRELRGFKGRLRGADAVEPEVEVIITRYLKKEIQEQLEAQRKQAIPEVQIDTGKLRRLQRESDQVRDMLLTEEAGQQAEVINSQPALEPAPSVGASSGHSEDAGTSTNMASPSKGRSSRKTAAKKPDVFQAVMDFDADPYEPGTIEVRDQLDEANGIVRSVNTEQSEADNGRFMEPSGSADDSLMQSMGSLEEHSSEAGGIHVMDPHVVDEEIYTVMPIAGEQSWQWEVEDEEWQELAERLNPIHLEVLHSLKTGPNRPGLQQIAEKAGSMPALLLDEINEAAMDTIGDLLIDGEAIADDYIDMLETLKPV